MNKDKKTQLPGPNKEDSRMKPVMPAENLEIDEDTTKKYEAPKDAIKAGVKQPQSSRHRNKNNSADPARPRQ